MHKMDLFINHEEQDERGQSLVEFVLVLPIILLLIAGVLEVTNILLVYNNVQQAAREGARYAAGGGVDNGVDEVVLDTISNNLDETHVNSIWIIRPEVAFTSTVPTDPSVLTWHPQGGSTAPWGIDEVCVYPNPCTDTTSGLTEDVVRKNFDAADNEDLMVNRGGIVKELSGEILTVVVVNYEAQTILNLSFFDYFGPGGTLPLRAWTVMRQEIESETLEKFNSGCSSYPIAINLLYGSAKKIYKASEGDLFTIPLNAYTLSTPADGFGFLDWTDQTSNSLNTDLADPSTSVSLPYDEPGSDPPDDSLHRDDIVKASAGDVASVQTQLQNHLDAGRALRVIGYYYSPDTNQNPGVYEGTTRVYRIDEFMIVKIAGIDVGNNIVTFEYLRLDNSCGYDLDQ